MLTNLAGGIKSKNNMFNNESEWSCWQNGVATRNTQLIKSNAQAKNNIAWVEEQIPLKLYQTWLEAKNPSTLLFLMKEKMPFQNYLQVKEGVDYLWLAFFLLCPPLQVCSILVHITYSNKRNETKG